MEPTLTPLPPVPASSLDRGEGIPQRRFAHGGNEDNTLQGLDKKKMAMALALCLIAIVVAVYMGVRTFAPPKADYPADFGKYGPSGPPGAQSAPPGSTPGSRR